MPVMYRTSVVAIFFIVWAANVVIPTLSNQEALHCSFEYISLCNWMNVEERWKVTQGSKDGSYGPATAHNPSHGLGYYAIATGYVRKLDNKSNLLLSPTINVSPAGFCFQFWYYLTGPGQLNVSLFVPGKKPASKRVLWSRTGPGEPEWTFGQVEVSQVVGSAILRFEGSPTLRHLVSVAVDDISTVEGECPKRYSCDFENDFCDFRQWNEDDFDWTLNRVSEEDDNNNNSGPGFDYGVRNRLHAGANFSSTFNNAAVNETKTAVFSLPPLASNSSFCLRFWNYARGSAYLHIIIQRNLKERINNISNNNNNESRIIWAKFGKDANDFEWKLAQIQVKTDQGSILSFKAIVTSNDQEEGQVAVDKVDVKTGVCPDVDFCDFEDSFCPWLNYKTGGDGSYWTRATAGRPSGGASVIVDHTLGTTTGKYLLLKGASSVGHKGATAKLFSPILDKSSFYCLSFWYLINGDGKLNVKYIFTNNGAEILRDSFHGVNGSGRSSWKLSSSSLVLVHRIFIEGVADQTQGKDLDDRSILIDDLSLKAGQCNPEFKCAKGRLTLRPPRVCDFHEDCPDGEEEKNCGYSCDFEEDDACKWKGAASKGTHWSTIKSDKKGHYYDPRNNSTFTKIEGGFISTIDDTGLFSHVQTNLTSPFLRRSAATCKLSFYVRSHFFESTWGIYIYKLVGHLSLSHLNTTLSLSKTWYRVDVPVGFTDAPFQMEIMTRKLSQWTSGIDIDDIHFFDCDFPHATTIHEENFRCESGGDIHASRRCNFVDDCGDNSDEVETLCSTFMQCDFEKDMCGWRQVKQWDDFDWTRQSVDLQRAQHTGPGFDHTTGKSTGHVMQMVSGERLAGDKAWLVSPVMRPTEDCWFSFYLFLYGAHVARFTAYKRTALGGELEKLIFRNGSHGQYWIFNTVHVSSSVDFQIVLEGVKGYFMSADIAIDDTSFSPQCKMSSQPLREKSLISVSPSSNPCNDSHLWQCDNGSECIPKFQICDFVPKCSDQSDERDCGTCDFESGTCGWRDISRGGFVWDLVNTTEIQGFKKPDKDHTYDGTEVGQYMLARDIGTGFTRISFLTSPVYGHSSPTCTIIFYHISTGWGTMELFLFPATTQSHEYANDGNLLWRSPNYSNRPKSWSRQAVNIGSHAAGYRLVFAYKKFLHLPAGTFALDDISFSTSCRLEKEAEKCSHDEFLCHSTTRCMSLHARCDFAKDCPDGEDEDDCDKSRMIDFQYDKGIFLNDPRDDFNWDRWSGSMRKEGVPSHDHTQGSYKGRYLYMKAEGISTRVEFGRIRSFVLYPNIHGDCFMRFFYQTKQTPYADMRVYTISGNKGKKSLLWLMKPVEQRTWTKVVIQLKSQTPFRVVIEGMRKRGYKGGFAIDDVTFSPHCFFIDKFLAPSPSNPNKPPAGLCQDGVEIACDESCLPVEFLCDFVSQCRDNADEATCPKTCGFEDGMCGWINKGGPMHEPFKRIDLTNVSQVNNSYFQGTGHALYALNAKEDEDHVMISTLVSPLFRRASNKCQVSFLYYSDIAEEITLSLRVNDFDKQLAYVDGHKSANRSIKTWNKFQKILPSCLTDFRILISVRLKKSHDVMFALIDNITFSGCHGETPTEKCPIGQFQCANGYCISIDRLCDVENDCCDESDEKPELCNLYEKFTFENGMAGWKNVVGTKYFWSIHTGWAHPYYYAGRPPHDHTKSSYTGHFLSTSVRQGHGRNASMLYEMPAPSDGICKVTFWYETNCRDLSFCVINVHLNSAHGSWRLIKSFKSSSTAVTWEKGDFRINASENYQIVFEGVLDSDASSTLNIDDIVFSPGCNGSLNATSLMTTSPSPFPAPFTQFPYSTMPELGQSVGKVSHFTTVETIPSEGLNGNEDMNVTTTGSTSGSLRQVSDQTANDSTESATSHPGDQPETTVSDGGTDGNNTWQIYLGTGVAVTLLVIIGAVIILCVVCCRGQQEREFGLCCRRVFMPANTSGIHNPSYLYDNNQGKGYFRFREST